MSLKKIQQEKEDAEEAADEAERLGDVVAAEERLANRAVNPNLRGGIGAARSTSAKVSSLTASTK